MVDFFYCTQSTAVTIAMYHKRYKVVRNKTGIWAHAGCLAWETSAFYTNFNINGFRNSYFSWEYKPLDYVLCYVLVLIVLTGITYGGILQGFRSGCWLARNLGGVTSRGKGSCSRAPTYYSLRVLATY